MTFDGRQECIRKMKIGERISARADPNNPHDANAVKVLNEKENTSVSFPADLARKLAAKMDRGVEYRAAVSDITGSSDPVLGVNLGSSGIIKRVP